MPTNKFKQIGIFLIVLLIIILAYVSCNKSLIDNSSEPVMNTLEQPTQLTPPPHNDVARYADYTPNFNIKTSDHSGYYYYLKVVDCISNETVQSVFIHSGKTASTYVPYGTYKVRWVSGEKWYGYEDLFNNSSAQEADDTFTFSSSQGWEITLYTVTSGNLSTDTINISDF